MKKSLNSGLEWKLGCILKTKKNQIVVYVQNDTTGNYFRTVPEWCRANLALLGREFGSQPWEASEQVSSCTVQHSSELGNHSTTWSG